MSPRQEFLLKMYDQMFNDINRHIMVVWQSVGVLIGAFAIFSLVEKNIVPLDVASSIIILISFWLLAHLFDAAYWYNRNLVIISNIERQFLVESDLKDIHCYFGAHRKENKMIEHLRIQLALGVTLGGIVLSYHFFERVLPGLSSPISNFEPIRALPYILVFFAVIYLFNLKKKSREKYASFISSSPGLHVDTIGIDYGRGHGQ
jgi:hypothetical protein